MGPAHKAIMSLPADVRQKVDLGFARGKDSGWLAKALHADGFFQQLSHESLSRALRKYRRDTFDVAEAARRASIERSSNPRVKAAIAKKTRDWDAFDEWTCLIQEHQKQYAALCAKYKDLTKSGVPPDVVRKAGADLHRMYVDYCRFCQDAGFMPKAPQVMHITSSMIVIRNDTDAGQVLTALADYLARTEGEGRSFLEQAVQSIARQLEFRGARDEIAGLLLGPPDRSGSENGPNGLPVLEGEEAHEGQGFGRGR